MKKILATLAIVAALAGVAGCTSSTEHGQCIGAFDDKDPALVYKLSGWNLFMGAIFFEVFFIPPIIVLVDETFCPVAKK